MKKHFNVLAIAAVLLIASCKKEDYKAPQSGVVGMSGTWWTEVYYDGDQDGAITNLDDPSAVDFLIISYSDLGEPALVTSNTASNSGDSILMDDILDLWPFKAKFPVDYSSLTMKPSTGNANLKIDGESISVITGKVLKGAATTLSGGKTDSIFVEFEFTDDPGNYYVFSGHKNTGFPEDVHQ